jgi:hypothetical protein
MRLDEKPMFKKIIVPWYATERACFFLILIMFFLFLFGLAGLSVANENNAYRAYIWVPFLLAVLSGAVIISTTVRLISRYMRRLSK